MIASQHSNGLPSPCNAPIIVPLVSLSSLPDAVAAICLAPASQCPRAAVLLDATEGYAVLPSERLLVHITQEMSVPCSSGPVATQGWSVVLVSDLGAERAGAEGGARGLLKAIKEGVLAGAGAWLVPAMYEHATKSVVYKAGSAAMVPFVAVEKEEDGKKGVAEGSLMVDGGRGGGSQRGRGGGATARWDIVAKCHREWKANGTTSTERKYTLEGMRDVFRWNPRLPPQRLHPCIMYLHIFPPIPSCRLLRPTRPSTAHLSRGIV